MSMTHRGDPFCANVRCILHVTSDSAGVVGWGNWAELPNGLIVGRGLIDGIPMCDLCSENIRAMSKSGVPRVAWR
jgi:hypothetical protein